MSLFSINSNKNNNLKEALHLNNNFNQLKN